MWLRHRNTSKRNRSHTNTRQELSKPGGGNVTEPGVEPTSSGYMTGDSTTHLKRSAVMSGTGIHRLIYRDICVAATAHNKNNTTHNHTKDQPPHVTTIGR